MPATSSRPTGGPHGKQGSGECELLGPFALLIQCALGVLALSTLVWKRYREKPRRPVKVWAFDVSKQVVGSSMLHIANLLMSMLSAGQLTVRPKLIDGPGKKYQPNPCSFYLLNLAIDTTLGIPVLIFFLRLLTRAFALTPLGVPPESIQSGNYGQPPRSTWWMKQCIIYFMGLLGMKLCVLVLFSLLPWLSQVGDWCLRWTEGNEMIQVFFVMLLFPLIMNALQYYIIDTYIKSHKPIELESAVGTGTDTRAQRGAREEAYAGHEADDEDDEDDDDDTVRPFISPRSEDAAHAAAPHEGPTAPRARADQPTQSGSAFKAFGDYDPVTDGEGTSSK
ncbi:MAG: hypothetical protein M1826_000481 [Phylliscum demangeonii]|nr:MAG: hypothetical protein M1826_000481 [Phylliscum demangeonii]